MYEHTWAVYSCIYNYQSHPNSLNHRSPHLKTRFLTQAGKTSSRVNFWRVAWYKGCTLCLCQASTFISLYSSWSFWWGPVKWMLYNVHICCPILSLNKAICFTGELGWITMGSKPVVSLSQFRDLSSACRPSLCGRKQKVLTIFANNIFFDNSKKTV